MRHTALLMLAGSSTVWARGPVAIATYEDGVEIRGFTELEGPPGCRAHFEYQRDGEPWTRWRFGLSDLPDLDIHLPMIPPHAFARAARLSPGSTAAETSYEPAPTVEYLVWPLRSAAMGWRIVDEHGEVVTDFRIAWAVDVGAFADLLGAGAQLDQGVADLRCVAPSPEPSCFTAFELWNVLEDWAETRCTEPTRD